MFLIKYKIIHYDVCRNKTGANALAFSKDYEKNNKVRNSKPEEEGCRLLPDIDQIQSIDSLCEMLKITKYEKYQIICDLFSHKIKIKN